MGALSGCPEAGSSCVPIADPKDTLDAWDNKFVYSSDGSGRSYTIKSLGGDKREGGTGTNGDIVKTGP